jgi:GT2 family glycosyltransferase
MLSIIVCSQHKKLPQEFIRNIDRTTGVEHEIIHIDNSENKYSIFSAYNHGASLSRYPFLCYVHEDVLFHTQNWGEKIIAHLREEQTGIIGVAGGNLQSRIPSSWSIFHPSFNIIQSDRSGRSRTKHKLYPVNYQDSKYKVVVLDGVFLCMRKELLNKIRFDEKMPGFHCYDFDITIQSHVAGYSNFVVYDLCIEHFSKGKKNSAYYRNLIYVFKKWENYLPLLSDKTLKVDKKTSVSLDEKMLHEIVRKMIIKEFSTKEILENTNYYARLISYAKPMRNIGYRIFFTRLFSCPQYFLKALKRK